MTLNLTLFAAHQLRLRNIAELRVGHTLLIGPDQAWIDIPEHRTKKGRPIRAKLPSHLEQHLRVYLTQIRPILLGKTTHDEGWLWIGRRGQRMPANDITTRVSRTTMKRLGRAVSPHLFRDCVATEIAIEDPAHIGITRSLLGHASLASSQKFYNQATSFTAFARHEAALRQIRQDADCN